MCLLISNVLASANQDADSTNKIWGHLQTISAIVDPAGGAREALKKSQTTRKDDTFDTGKTIEGSFLGNVVDTIQIILIPTLQIQLKL